MSLSLERSGFCKGRDLVSMAMFSLLSPPSEEEEVFFGELWVLINGSAAEITFTVSSNRSKMVVGLGFEPHSLQQMEGWNDVEICFRYR